MSDRGAPEARRAATAVWTGRELIVWGGCVDDSRSELRLRFLATGARYDPCTDRWTPVAERGAPDARAWHAAVWTGREMIVWGGSGDRVRGDGAAYDPVRDVWRTVSTTGAPRARAEHSAVWTGREMIVFGGVDDDHAFADGGRYDPATDAWRPIARAEFLVAPRAHAAVWTGSAMLVWGGVNGSRVLRQGGRYDPVSDRWATVSTERAPSARGAGRAVWTGTALAVWGRGPDPGGGGHRESASLYDPAADRWSALPEAGSPAAREDPVFAWTGRELLVWGGREPDRGGSGRARRDGAAFDHSRRAWRTLEPPPGGFAGRRGGVAAWTGDELIVWGGDGDTGPLSDGVRLAPRRGAE